jgi:hypothetical protein
VANVVKPDEKLAYYGDNENYTFSFYSRRPIVTIKDKNSLYAYMSAAEKRYLVLTEKFYKKLAQAAWKVKVTGAFSEHDSWGGYVLLSNG